MLMKLTLETGENIIILTPIMDASVGNNKLWVTASSMSMGQSPWVRLLQELKSEQPLGTTWVIFKCKLKIWFILYLENILLNFMELSSFFWCGESKHETWVLPSGICAMMFRSQLNLVAGLSALKMTYNDRQYQCTCPISFAQMLYTYSYNW